MKKLLATALLSLIFLTLFGVMSQRENSLRAQITTIPSGGGSGTIGTGGDNELAYYDGAGTTLAGAAPLIFAGSATDLSMEFRKGSAQSTGEMWKVSRNNGQSILHIDQADGRLFFAPVTSDGEFEIRRDDRTTGAFILNPTVATTHTRLYMHNNTTIAWHDSGGTDGNSVNHDVGLRRSGANHLEVTDSQLTPARALLSFAPGGSGVTCANYSKSVTDLTTASATEDETLFNLPARGKVHGVSIKHTTAFSGGSLSAMTVSVGDSSSATFYAGAFDVFQAVSDTAFQDSDEFKSSTYAARDVIARFTATGDTVDNATAGAVDINVCWSLLP